MNYCQGHPDVRHTDAHGKGCGGQLAVTGEGRVQLPTGFGFPDSKGFAVDVLRCPAYSGFCLECGASGTFIRVDRKGRAARIRPKIKRRAKA